MAYELHARRREKMNPRALRRSGRVPAVVYGRGVHELLSVDRKELERLFAKITHSSRITLKLDTGEEYRTFIKEIQFHPLTDEILHVDFYQPPVDRPVTMEVPVHLHGEAKGRKAGGVVEQILETVEVRGPIHAIPELIEVDISNLDIGDSIHAGELALPEGVELQTAPDVVVVTVLAPRKEEELVAAEAEVAAEAPAGEAAPAEGEAPAPGPEGGQEKPKSGSE